ncbi:hypothetical protein J7E29_02505 [Streptomyces sp. ISL-90]|nr:hypothetical protein [Streptomyces sp. ISL-90]
MRDEIRQYLARNPERLERADAFLSESAEPTADLGEILLDAQIAAAERFDESARARSLWLVRLSGDAIDDGWIDHGLQEAIIGPLSREVELATPREARRESRIGLVGVSSGSVILHFRPKLSQRRATDDQLSYEVSPADAAILRVSQLHDLLEEQAPASEIAGRFGRDQSLLKQTKQLVVNLAKHNVNLSTRWWSSDATRKTSRLTLAGQQHGLRVFETTIKDDDQRLRGMVTALDISGQVTLTDAAGNKYRVDVGRDAIRSDRFALGSQLFILARREQEVDNVGLNPSRATYRFVRHLDDNPLPL